MRPADPDASRLAPTNDLGFPLPAAGGTKAALSRFTRTSMFGRKTKTKKNDLYYLLPGMTRSNRDKRRRLFWYSLAIGLVVSAAIAGIIILMNRVPGR